MHKKYAQKHLSLSHIAKTEN